MNIIKTISEFPGLMQVAVYLIGTALSVGLIVFLVSFTFGLIIVLIEKMKNILISIISFGFGLAGKACNPIVESIYRKSVGFRQNIIHRHRLILREIKYSRIRDELQAINDSEPLKISTIKGKREILPLWEKFPATIRTEDGHIVRSNPEKMIDDWFSMQNIFHHYERRLPFPGIHYCDFYLPQGHIYIEYWGLESDDYIKRKDEKIRLYSEYNLQLISIEESDLRDLDHFLQERLRRFQYLPLN